MSSMPLAALCAIVALLTVTPALTDPCKAIPDKGPAPIWLHKGATFGGLVPYVGDGDSLCVDVSFGGSRWTNRPEDWVEVRLADFYSPELHGAGGPEAKAALERVVRGKFATCVADHRSYDRIVATCRIGGVSVGDLMRRAGVAEGGRGR